jgi:hypothetical protein
MPEYVALIYADEADWEGLSDDERSSIMDRYMLLSRNAREAGVMVDGSELASTRDATTVRVRRGDTAVTDGPYAEAKEALGGFYLFECPTIDDAVEWAAQIPAAERGAVEVRPVYVDEEAAA